VQNNHHVEKPCSTTTTMANASLHNAWAAGHFILLLSFARYAIAWLTLKWSGYDTWYKASFIGALISYSIVCYKSLGTPQFNKGYFQRAMMDENAQYFLLALFWLFTKPVSVAVLPYAIFSLFHALTFTRTNILPRLVQPPVPQAAGANGQPQANQSPVAKKIHVWVKNNYEPAMSMVARIELFILGRTVLGALFFRNSILVPLLYAHFLRLRYYYSAFTRDAVRVADEWIAAQIVGPSIPPQVKKAWEFARAGIVRWGGNILEPGQQPAQQQPQAPPRAAPAR